MCVCWVSASGVVADTTICDCGALCAPQAQEYAAELTFGGGKEPLCSSTLDLDKMGVSIGLYFRLMKYLSVLFFLMSVIAIPILWACRVGTRVSPQDIDPFKLNIWSLGNVNNGAFCWLLIHITVLGQIRVCMRSVLFCRACV